MPCGLRWKRLSCNGYLAMNIQYDFALCNWNIAQPRIKKYLSANFSFFRGVVFLFFHGER